MASSAGGFNFNKDRWEMFRKDILMLFQEFCALRFLFFNDRFGVLFITSIIKKQSLSGIRDFRLIDLIKGIPEAFHKGSHF